MTTTRKCARCGGDGMSPTEHGKKCRKCYGVGRTSKNFVYRLDGRVEQLCEHGTGHTISIRAVERPSESWWTHGCDGCCSTYKRYE